GVRLRHLLRPPLAHEPAVPPAGRGLDGAGHGDALAADGRGAVPAGPGGGRGGGAQEGVPAGVLRGAGPAAGPAAAVLPGGHLPAAAGGGAVRAGARRRRARARVPGHAHAAAAAGRRRRGRAAGTREGAAGRGPPDPGPRRVGQPQGRQPARARLLRAALRLLDGRLAVGDGPRPGAEGPRQGPHRLGAQRRRPAEPGGPRARGDAADRAGARPGRGREGGGQPLQELCRREDRLGLSEGGKEREREGEVLTVRSFVGGWMGTVPSLSPPSSCCGRFC
ncbi:hypothetical protein F4780DRAFT_795905, partial [Xylariomycetidae sp. FL0641]